MIRDVNDDPDLLPPLVQLARRVHAFVNLIPFNPIPYVDWKPSRAERVRAFQDGLSAAGVPVAACGQLRASRLRTGRVQASAPARPPGTSAER